MHYLIRFTVAIITFGLGSGLAGLAGIVIPSPAAFFTTNFSVRPRKRCPKRSVPPVELESGSIRAEWVFVEKELTWFGADALAGSDQTSDPSTLESASANLTIFLPSGKFAVVRCILLRDPNHPTRIWMSNDGIEGQRVYVGTWERNSARSIVAVADFSHSTGNIISRLPERRITQRWSVDPGSLDDQAVIRTDSTSYIHLKDFGSQDLLTSLVKKQAVFQKVGGF